MRRTILILILLLFTIVKQGGAQSKSVYFQINTLKIHEIPASEFSFKVMVTNQGFLNMGDQFDSSISVEQLLNADYCSVLRLESDSSGIKLDVDQHGSYVLLNGAYNQDTVIIDQLDVYHTQPPDTTYSVLATYEVKDGSLQDSTVKLERKESFEKMKSPPQQVIITINGKKYTCELKLVEEPSIEVSHGHGYKPRNPRNKKGEYKKKVEYIDINSSTRKYYWQGLVEL